MKNEIIGNLVYVMHIIDDNMFIHCCGTAYDESGPENIVVVPFQTTREPGCC